jgi:retron-type reverse transcriptase
MQDMERYLLKKAFKILRRNYGCPGNDGISIKDIKINYNNYENTVWGSLEKHTYTFEQEPKCVTINDYLGNEREIFVYNVIERWIQQFIGLQIEPIIDSVLQEYVYAYRRGKNDIDSYKYILNNNPNFILRVDIKNYFSFIDRGKLFVMLKELNIENNLLNIIQKSFEHYEKGLPPGHVLSCMLSNLYLKDFDSEFPEDYTRYSDDMMFACRNRMQAYKALWTVSKLLKVYGLSLNHKKTRLINNPTLENLI